MQLILLSKLTCGQLFSDCFNSYLGLVSSTKSASFVFHFLDKLIINYLLSNKTRPVHLDNDGDIDVLASAYFSGEIVWYENLDGQGNFSARKVVDIIPKTFSVIAADVDSDGDLDIIGVSDDHGLFWFENLDGNGNFSEKNPIDNQIFSRSV